MITLISYKFNPLVPEGRNIYRIPKNFRFLKKGITEKISYEKRIYESVDNKGLFQILTENLFSGTNGLT